MDAELIELCWRWCRLDRVWLHTEQKAADADEAGEHELYERLCEISDQIYDNVIVMAQQIAGIPAHSWAGIAASRGRSLRSRHRPRHDGRHPPADGRRRAGSPDPLERGGLTRAAIRERRS